MTDQVLTWTFVFVGIASMGMLVWGMYTWPRGEKCRCKGSRLGWRGLFKLSWVFWRGRCWYNLAHLHDNENGMIQCPECGSFQSKTRLRRDGRRFRLCRFALLLGAVTFTFGYYGPYTNGTWPKAIPTYPLIMLSNTSFGDRNREIHREIELRVKDGLVTGDTATKLSDRLVLDLRADHISWNASSAGAMLRTLWPASRESLEREILVGDRQSRTLSANLLRRRSKKPSAQLLIGCVSDLRDDWEEGGYNYSVEGNARSAMYYLLRWWEPAAPYLRQAMQSDDPQQRFLAAVILGFAGSEYDTPRVIEVLAPYLRDNQTVGDAKLAAPAIYNLGASAIPFLEHELDLTDEQGAKIVRNIIERLTFPDRAYNQCDHPTPRLTGDAADPLTASLKQLTMYFWINIKD